MNKIITLASFLAILACQEIEAQTEKSTWLLGGAAYFEAHKGEAHALAAESVPLRDVLIGLAARTGDSSSYGPPEPRR